MVMGRLNVTNGKNVSLDFSVILMRSDIAISSDSFDDVPFYFQRISWHM